MFMMDDAFYGIPSRQTQWSNPTFRIGCWDRPPEIKILETRKNQSSRYNNRRILEEFGDEMEGEAAQRKTQGRL
jgi:hypothetical protein